ncbi:uncharacterized protein J4E88_005985 [Alternaria novae-zelandiae]|uniref:uncharacterized protein n=1 Tax=Alternaria novae-zelandiae TaxID=430562 RepID=UPI0020C1D5B3|nr:uncharacterized protein J4E88_005985 [Alternaria novae-zelandiae]KAI4680094.1 hypothetical protein J4E88_005985 [Alternaria novae-zelandiae]
MRPSPVFSLRIRSFVSRHDVVPPSATVQKPIEAAYYRGGTSRGVILQPQALPKERARWPTIFRQIMGSGDPYGRQLDGMGAGISSLSKICLVEPYGRRVALPERATRFRTGFGGIDAARKSAQAAQAAEALEEAKATGEEPKLDIDYTFVGLGIEDDEVDVAGNCGNMSSAIGPYAYNAGLLPSRIYAQGDGEVTVKIRNTNTGKLLDSTFEVIGAQAAVAGDYSIDGVTGKGSKIRLDFKRPYGSKTGRVLPTGRRVDNIGGYRVSCIDGANPAIFVRADDVGVDGTILPDDFNNLQEKLALLESIRKAAAVVMGIASTEDEVPRTVPKIGIVSQSSAHPVLSGKTLKASQMDIVVRFLSDTQPHRAIPLTAALTTAVAARIPGTVVEQMLAPEPLMEGAITIGHASGRLQVNATMDARNKLIPASGTVYRTAKRLLEGNIFWADKFGETEPREDTTETDTSYGSNGRHSLGLAFVLENRGKDSSHLFEEDVARAKQQSADADMDRIISQQPTLEQIEENEQKEEPEVPILVYRPLPDPHRKRRDLREIPKEEDALTLAIQGLHSELTGLLHDEKIMDTTEQNSNLLEAVLRAHRDIQINSLIQRRSAEKASEKAKRSMVQKSRTRAQKVTAGGKLRWEHVERAISARVTEKARKRVESWGRTERTDNDDMDEHMGKRVEREMTLQGDGGEQQDTERSVRDDMEEWMRKRKDEDQKRSFREDMEIWKRNAQKKKKRLEKKEREMMGDDMEEWERSQEEEEEEEDRRIRREALDEILSNREKGDTSMFSMDPEFDALAEREPGKRAPRDVGPKISTYPVKTAKMKAKRMKALYRKPRSWNSR